MIGNNYHRFGSNIFRPYVHICEALLFLGVVISLNAHFSSEKEHSSLSLRQN